MRYIPASTKLIETDTSGAFQIYLARGRDRAGHTYGDPTKPNARWMQRQAAAG